MITLDDEKTILDIYRQIPSNKIQFNGRYFNCMRIKTLTKSIIFSKSWINSSSKDSKPPDFHNNLHHIMLEIMRVDDCLNEINGKHILNSFAITNKNVSKQLGKDYKKRLNGVLCYIPNTNNSDEFNFKGYINNFKRTIEKHSSKITKYKENYPKCKITVFLICDESNNYIQVSNKEDLKRENEHNLIIDNFLPHICYLDNKFIDIIKDCKADYVIWVGYYKSLFVNGKEIKQPRACIYDVNHLKEKGFDYNHELMFKVKEDI